AGRVSAGVVVIVFAASVTLGYLPLLGGVRSGGASETLSDGVVSVDLFDFGAPSSTTEAVSSVEGVGTTVPMRYLVGRAHGPHDVALLPCSQLGSVLRTTPTGCTPGAVLVNGDWVLKPLEDGGGGLRPGTEVRLRTQEDDRVGTIHIPAKPKITELPVLPFTQLLIDEAAVSRKTLSAAPVSRLLVQTDGRPETIEQIREALALLVPAGYSSVSTRAMLAELEGGGGGGVATAVRIGTIIALAVAAVSMLISTIGAMQERRRPLAALAAIGVPMRALRWSVAVQTMAPLLAGTLLAASAAMVVVASTAREAADTSRVIAPILPILPIVAFAVLAGIMATLLAFPSAARGISPDALHYE
ncbi:MAG: FtsX-like permease family protein, partial [Actinomycetota bacterium]